MTSKKSDLSQEGANAISNISLQLHEIKSSINELGNVPDLNKKYLTPQDIEDEYSFKKSLQANLRMDTECGPPYVRPSGARIVLYNREEFEKWLEEWRVSQ